MIDPFETLGVEPRFALDLPAVEQRHRDLSKALHPDRYTGAPAAERRMALSRAIDVNESLRMLKDPVRRAEALLRRAGVATDETASAPKPPPSLLMEMMERREELSDAAHARDATRVAEMARVMRAREAQVEERLGVMLDGVDAGGPSPHTVGDEPRAALSALGELRYVRRFLDEVSAIEDELAAVS